MLNRLQAIRRGLHWRALVFLPIFTSIIGVVVLGFNLRHDLDHKILQEWLGSRPDLAQDLDVNATVRSWLAGLNENLQVVPRSTSEPETTSSARSTSDEAPVRLSYEAPSAGPNASASTGLQADLAETLLVEPAAGPDAPRSCPAFDAPLDQVALDLKAKKERLDERSLEIDVQTEAMRVMREQLAVDLARLDALRAEIQTLVEQVGQEEEDRLQQLVKVYENMKAKRAAEIFDRLAIEVILSVATRMREAKLADILASMNPDKARLVTTQLAVRNDILSQ